jgi:hypothetical protein
LLDNFNPKNIKKHSSFENQDNNTKNQNLIDNDLFPNRLTEPLLIADEEEDE